MQMESGEFLSVDPKIGGIRLLNPKLLAPGGWEMPSSKECSPAALGNLRIWPITGFHLILVTVPGGDCREPKEGKWWH